MRLSEAEVEDIGRDGIAALADLATSIYIEVVDATPQPSDALMSIARRIAINEAVQPIRTRIEAETLAYIRKTHSVEAIEAVRLLDLAENPQGLGLADNFPGLDAIARHAVGVVMRRKRNRSLVDDFLKKNPDAVLPVRRTRRSAEL